MDQLTAEDPTHIGPYRLIARLGAGGMGLVYLGRSEGGRTVAVKVVQAEYAGNSEFRRRFAREVAAARLVGGSWTAAVLDADHEAAVPWVATQYIPGPDLHSVVAKDYGPLPEYSVRALANRLALALGTVHEAGLIHRDLKPSNVLVTVDGPRVIDFGIARAMDSLAGDSLHTRTGMLIGSPGFMSPEQVRGLELTPASDVFCLGAVLVYAATGRMLFGATDTGLNAHLFRVAEEEADLTGVPDSLVDLVRACLEKDPARRPTPRQIAERTAADGTEEWLPGSVLAQLGRHAAQLLDFAPPAAPAPPTPAVPAQQDPRVALAQHGAPPHGTPPAYAPTAPAHPAAGQGFGPPGPAAAWSAATAPAHPYDVPPADPRRWRVLALAVLVQLLVELDLTVFGGSASFIHMDLGVGSDLMDAVFRAYVVAVAVVILLGGHLVDGIGRRKTLIAGLTVFVAAAALNGSATAELLVATRALQGVAAGLLVPAALALVARAFTDPRERRTAFGVYAAVAVGGTAVGMLVSGVFTELLSWRTAVYVGVPPAVLALIAALRLVREPVAAAGPGTPPRFDAGAVLFGSVGLGALVYGLDTVRVAGDAPGLGWILTAVGLLLFLGFLWWQRTTPDALFGPYALRDGHRTGALLALVLLGTALPVLYFLVTMRLQFILGFGPIVAGLMALPAALAAVVAARLAAGRLSAGTTPRALVVTGTLFTAAGLAALGAVPEHMVYAVSVLPALLVAGAGAGLALMPLYAAVFDGMPGERVGAVAALAGAAGQVGAGSSVLMLHHTNLVIGSSAAIAALLAMLVGGLTARGRGVVTPGAGSTAG
ncbi:MFS transporter [Streptomyces sp. NPDC127092]|uniref:MFS transporter n=1 Tax=Streptomyces sp. NPDC127092 TaxID=3347135 RepID=UPI00364AA920